MAEGEGFIESHVDGLKLYARSWVPLGKVKAVVVLAHGVGEHCGRYEKLGRALGEEGIVLYGMDHRGHGRSGDVDKRAFFWQFDHLVHDFDNYVSKIIDAYASDARPAMRRILEGYPPAVCPPKVPVFIFGHSMGGLVATRYMQDFGCFRPIQGMVLSSPFFDATQAPGFLQRQAVSCVTQVFPKLGVLGLDACDLSHRSDEVEKYLRDPFVTTSKLSANVLNEMLLNAAVAKGGMHVISVPLLLVHGTADRICSPTAAEECFQRTSTADKTVSLYDGGYHELLHEISHIAEKVTTEIVQWFKGHISIASKDP